MIIIPELKKVVILTPRTGSGSLRRAIRGKYPLSMQIYRHMEADGVPQGYDRWERVGVVRNPLDRLWSLYKFLQNFDGAHEPTYIQRMRQSVQCSFSDYILHNNEVFTSPYCKRGSQVFYPEYTVRHPLPENRKSQFIYLRPDLGTKIYQYQALGALLFELGITLRLEVNETPKIPMPDITAEAEEYMKSFFEWDYVQSR